MPSGRWTILALSLLWRQGLYFFEQGAETVYLNTNQFCPDGKLTLLTNTSVYNIRVTDTAQLSNDSSMKCSVTFEAVGENGRACLGLESYTNVAEHVGNLYLEAWDGPDIANETQSKLIYRWIPMDLYKKNNNTETNIGRNYNLEEYCSFSRFILIRLFQEDASDAVDSTKIKVFLSVKHIQSNSRISYLTHFHEGRFIIRDGLVGVTNRKSLINGIDRFDFLCKPVWHIKRAYRYFQKDPKDHRGRICFYYKPNNVDCRSKSIIAIMGMEERNSKPIDITKRSCSANNMNEPLSKCTEEESPFALLTFEREPNMVDSSHSYPEKPEMFYVVVGVFHGGQNISGEYKTYVERIVEFPNSSKATAITNRWLDKRNQSDYNLTWTQAYSFQPTVDRTFVWGFAFGLVTPSVCTALCVCCGRQNQQNHKFKLLRRKRRPKATVKFAPEEIVQTDDANFTPKRTIIHTLSSQEFKLIVETEV